MPFKIIRNDITKVKADAIVNTANPFPVFGDGTDTAIYMAAGMVELLAEREKIGMIEPGHTEYTPAFQLHAKYIFHTVGPSWVDGKHGERKILRNCYRSALALADQLSCRSIAFPLLASGSYRFPKDEALQIALEEIQKFLFDHEMRVMLVVFDQEAFELSGKLVGQIEEYIDEHSVGRLHYQEYGEWYADRYVARTVGRTRLESGTARREVSRTARTMMPAVPPKPKSLDDVLADAGDTFQQRLFHLIDESGMDDVTVYKKANISKALFSKIKCNVDYTPKKQTVIAFAIALHLDMDATQDLLACAGLTLSPSKKFDLIISYFITHHDYDIFKINATLFDYDQPLLGF